MLDCTLVVKVEEIIEFQEVMVTTNKMLTHMQGISNIVFCYVEVGEWTM